MNVGYSNVRVGDRRSLPRVNVEDEENTFLRQRSNIGSMPLQERPAAR